MILHGNPRGGGMQLYHHLTNIEDNDHVELHDIRGFVSDNPQEAVKEAYALSLGTRCKQFLFSLSLNPPPNESVSAEDFEKAIRDTEKKLGLTGQPRFSYFHEKNGRRHAHCVWSRIDVENMKAIELPFHKLNLREVSREQYFHHGWKMPHGLMNSEERDPLNFTHDEWQQAKRLQIDVREVKRTIQECWAVSDSKVAFQSALKERGYYLAQGNKARHVIMDWRGNIFAVTKMTGLRAKEVRDKIGLSDDLSTVDEISKHLKERFTDKLKEYSGEVERKQIQESEAFRKQRKILVQKQRAAREQLKQRQEARRVAETKERAARLPKGVTALWYRVTGKYKTIKKEIEEDYQSCQKRDADEKQKQIDVQLAERRNLHRAIRMSRHRDSLRTQKLNSDMAKYLSMLPEQQEDTFKKRERKKQVKRVYHRRIRGPTMH